jgi:hypothetical protein
MFITKIRKFLDLPFTRYLNFQLSPLKQRRERSGGEGKRGEGGGGRESCSLTAFRDLLTTEDGGTLSVDWFDSLKGITNLCSTNSCTITLPTGSFASKRKSHSCFSCRFSSSGVFDMLRVRGVRN